ncbi:Cyclohexanone monooxygenase [Enhygromyxa salina]|uniref:Cyclohexanone monooxygenase n=1 Tax=Enhygromyxa salina TaxID=215803 RepID=A0A0C2DFN5_9BACT|nr:NAD(P)/FAD-dependent oxidoreductase [Enhygromyxa salina]KIG18442.1 Cyclohexanone monooxygenase [Enhygromyxa salina]
MRIAIIGSGISGIAWAATLQRDGHEVVVFERSGQIGGVWANAYPEVRLQNTWTQYHLAEFPWPFRPDDHPTGAQILRYLAAAVEHAKIDLRCDHEVVALTELPHGWRATIRTPTGTHEAAFDYVVVAVGQYTQPKTKLEIADRERFRGEIVTERELDDLDRLAAKRVAVVGYGKSAVDLATFAAKRGSRVEHVVRTPRWLIPLKIAGVLHYTFALFTRISSVMVPCWAHPTAAERFLHSSLAGLVPGFWAMVGAVVQLQYRAAALGHGAAARARIRQLMPTHSLVADMRSAAALAPQGYFGAVARAEITPHRGVLSRFVENGIVLTNGTELPCELVVLCLGSGSPVFPFMPARYRELLEAEPDGVQLYRHLIHPRIPRLAFAGYNHGFMHVPAAEVGALWISATIRGELELPSVEQMEAAIEHVRAYKRAHVNFEPSRSCAVNTRFQQYLDILLAELGVSPYRKPHLLAELFSRYEAADYAGIIAEYHAAQTGRDQPRRPSDLAT